MGQAKVTEFTGNILLVGISYDKRKKRHTYKIRKFSSD